MMTAVWMTATAMRETKTVTARHQIVKGGLSGAGAGPVPGTTGSSSCLTESSVILVKTQPETCVRPSAQVSLTRTEGPCPQWWTWVGLTEGSVSLQPSPTTTSAMTSGALSGRVTGGEQTDGRSGGCCPPGRVVLDRDRSRHTTVKTMKRSSESQSPAEVESWQQFDSSWLLSVRSTGHKDICHLSFHLLASKLK